MKKISQLDEQGDSDSWIMNAAVPDLPPKQPQVSDSISNPTFVSPLSRMRNLGEAIGLVFTDEAENCLAQGVAGSVK